jgi:hypothetical protein
MQLSSPGRFKVTRRTWGAGNVSIECTADGGETLNCVAAMDEVMALSLEFVRDLSEFPHDAVES